MEIKGRVAVVTGAGSGIGQAVSVELARRGVKAIGLVDLSDQVHQTARQINDQAQAPIAYSFIGDTTDAAFRKKVYDEIQARTGGVAAICVPAAGITRDALAVRVDKETGKAVVYPDTDFDKVLKVNLIAPAYWAMEMIARIAEDRFKRGLKGWRPEEHIQGTIIFLGSVSSQGIKGQVSYAATKRGLEGVADTLMIEAMYYGVRCAVVHPGFTDTPMVGKLKAEYIEKYVIPNTTLKRLIKPSEIADAVCFMIANSAVGQELWADAGFHPSA